MVQVLLLILVVWSGATPSARVALRIANKELGIKISIVRDTSIPPDSVIFANEEELLASINTSSGGNGEFLCGISMTSLAPTNEEKQYKTDWMCD